MSIEWGENWNEYTVKMHSDRKSLLCSKIFEITRGGKGILGRWKSWYIPKKVFLWILWNIQSILEKYQSVIQTDTELNVANGIIQKVFLLCS